MIQITIGLRRAHDGTHSEATSRARKYLLILYAGCLIVFLLTVCVEIFNLTGTFGFDEHALQLYYFILTPILFVTYYVSLYKLKNYMNTKENPALLPEKKKMDCQAGFYMFSLALFEGIRGLLLFSEVL